jgi:ribosomal protein S27AE
VDEDQSKIGVDGCPGSEALKKPKPEYQKCPKCGEEVEIWTDEVKAVCGKCGQEVLRGETLSCIEWCEHAEACIGSQKYKQFMEQKKRGEKK